MLFVIVFPTPTTVIVAKQVFNKYLSHERRTILRIRKHSSPTSLWYILEEYFKQLRDETKGKANEWYQ